MTPPNPTTIFTRATRALPTVESLAQLRMMG